MLASAVASIVRFSTRFPWPVIVLAAVLTLVSALYAGTHFAINTDAESLLPRNLSWRQSELNYKATFPQRQMLAVVEGPTPELTQLATARLTAELEKHPDHIKSVRMPQGGAFFARNALLFLPTPQLQQTVQQLREAGPLAGMLGADPSLRGVMQALSAGIQGAEQNHFPATALTRPMTELSATLDALFAGKRADFSWQQLLSGQPASPAQLRGFVEIEPKLDFSALQPGHAAEETVREAARQLQLGPQFGATVRLTGELAINDEQFATLSHGAVLNLLGTVVAVLFIIWLALRSGRIIASVFASLVVGFAVTAATGLLMVGSFNLISIAFAVLFIGLGADFGIQLAVRYRSERHDVDNIETALERAAEKAGGPLALAAASTAAGFLSFLPTDYLGVSELGLIAGVGMIIAFAATITVMPALLCVVNPPPEPRRMGFSLLAPADRFLARHRIAVVAGTILVVLAGTPLLFHMRFDFDPMHLQNPNGEAVKTYTELSSLPEMGVSAGETVAPSVDDAQRMAKQFEKLPEVASVRTVHTLVPADQEAKLPLIEGAAKALRPMVEVRPSRPAPTDAENVEAIRTAAGALQAFAAHGGDQASANRLAGLLTRLADGDPGTRIRLQLALITPLQLDLQQMKAMLNPEPVSLQTLPPDLVRDWIAPNGRARIEIMPKGDPTDITVLQNFANAVMSVDPDATGIPISLMHSQHTVVRAFVEAGIWAIVAIAIILWIVLRRIGDVLLTLIPLIVAGAVTLELTVLLDQPLNFANVIALPLLLGVGVAFKIYYIMAWRAGSTNLLQSTLTHAVFFSALTTATAFGSLWLSNQPGMSSMGKLMALALVCTLAAAVLFQPALMGPPRERRPAPHDPSVRAVAEEPERMRDAAE
jgi:hypothetical protein